jgi:hypothetical protein
LGEEEGSTKIQKIPLPSKRTDEVIGIKSNPFHDSDPEKTETALEEGGLKDLEEPVYGV